MFSYPYVLQCVVFSANHTLPPLFPPSLFSSPLFSVSPSLSSSLLLLPVFLFSSRHFSSFLPLLLLLFPFSPSLFRHLYTPFTIPFCSFASPPVLFSSLPSFLLLSFLFLSSFVACFTLSCSLSSSFPPPCTPSHLSSVFSFCYSFSPCLSLSLSFSLGVPALPPSLPFVTSSHPVPFSPILSLRFFSHLLPSVLLSD